MTNSTDVRDWLRAQGREVKDRGRLPAGLVAEYEAAHPAAAAAGGGDYDGGVTEADFPDPGGDEDGPAPAAAAAAPETERAPRPVRPARPGPGRFTKLLGGGAKRPKPKHARTSLGDFAEGLWSDAAYFAPFPPLQRMLTIQAPYAGVVLDDAVKGTIVDRVLQPAARAEASWRALDGLLGPPLIVGAICMTGRRDDRTGELDARTRMLFGALRYSLVNMDRVSLERTEAIEARAGEMEARGAKADAMIALLFGDLMAPPPAAAAADDRPPGPWVEGDLITDPTHPYPQPGPRPGTMPVFRYPAAAPMDATGADPGRM